MPLTVCIIRLEASAAAAVEQQLHVTVDGI
jgi:hypothetical protein